MNDATIRGLRDGAEGITEPKPKAHCDTCLWNKCCGRTEDKQKLGRWCTAWAERKNVKLMEKPKKTPKPRICASCRAGYADETDPEVGPAEADFYVQGRVWGSHQTRMRPYQGYLCADHVTMMEDDGAVFTVCRKIQKEDK